MVYIRLYLFYVTQWDSRRRRRAVVTEFYPLFSVHISTSSETFSRRNEAPPVGVAWFYRTFFSLIPSLPSSARSPQPATRHSFPIVRSSSSIEESHYDSVEAQDASHDERLTPTRVNAGCRTIRLLPRSTYARTRERFRAKRSLFLAWNLYCPIEHPTWTVPGDRSDRFRRTYEYSLQETQIRWPDTSQSRSFSVALIIPRIAGSLTVRVWREAYLRKGRGTVPVGGDNLIPRACDDACVRVSAEAATCCPFQDFHYRCRPDLTVAADRPVVPVASQVVVPVPGVAQVPVPRLVDHWEVWPA